MFLSWVKSFKLIKLTFSTIVGDYIKIMKTTFDFNFDLYPALNSIDTQKHGSKEKLSIKKIFSLTACKLVIQEKLVNNYNLNKKVVLIILI